MNPKFPKRETEILHDKANLKSPRIEYDQPMSNHKSILTSYCNSKEDHKPSENEIPKGDTNAEIGIILCLRDFDESFSNIDDESDNKLSSVNEIPIDETNVDKGKFSCFDGSDQSFSDTDDESDDELSSSKSASYKGLDCPVQDNPCYKNDEEFDRLVLEGMEALDVKPHVVLKDSDVPEYVLYCLRTQMKGGDYEYVKHVSTIPVVLKGWFGVHTNFFARLQGTDSAPELFFAALKNGCPMKVEECCILNPRPFSIGETNPDKDMVVYHCEHVQCDYCNEPFQIDHLDIDKNSFICI